MRSPVAARRNDWRLVHRQLLEQDRGNEFTSHLMKKFASIGSQAVARRTEQKWVHRTLFGKEKLGMVRRTLQAEQSRDGRNRQLLGKPSEDKSKAVALRTERL
ncbi:hypothetical protein chiPu_0014827 [Chiloscyllium punctatum]|uniref:Uncharacterized protein n=1 Tax=Chiloscyllium punctatum TaxID=137246 RepID=A0A401T105_CHIPU|nr:hypothetical protein [Chiloscyllium punctatum]